MTRAVPRAVPRVVPVAVAAVLATAAAAGAVTAGSGAARTVALAGTPGSAGVGDRLFPRLGNGGYDVTAYSLRLTYPRTDVHEAVPGAVTITAVATQALSRFDLDYAGARVGSVLVDGRAARFSLGAGELVVTPPAVVPKGRRFQVEVLGFAARPVPPNPKAPTSPPFVATRDGTVLAGQPAGMHAVFPCSDHPSDKASWTITLNTPRGWIGVANGVLASRSASGSRTVWRYVQARPMATELVQAAVGDFTVSARRTVAGVPVRDVVPRRLASTLPAVRRGEDDAVAWVARTLGSYPFDVYGALAVDARLGFALETQTLSLFGTSASAVSDRSRAQSAAHEFAHQWFGDDVSPAVWSDLWLNEGHATWYQVAYTDAKGWSPAEATYRKLYRVGDVYRATYGPVAAPRGATDAQLFNPDVYSGGALALYALRQQIGAGAFATLEHRWLTTYGGRSASTADFVALASAVAGQDLGPFLRSWLYGTRTPPMPGHPDWTVAPATNAAAVALAQKLATTGTR